MKIIVAGYPGAMATYTVNMIAEHRDWTLLGVFNPQHFPEKEADLPCGAKWFDDLNALPTDCDVWIDFTLPQVAAQNAAAALQAGMHPIVGTSGITPEDLTMLQTLAQGLGIGGLVVPNFGLSAVLLMQFAKQAAAYFPDAEIIEMHHEDKQDAPSGTAKATAAIIAAGRTSEPRPTTAGPGRGEQLNGVPVHAVRLPGYVAHQQVLFGVPGEALTIRQDSFDRKSFMSGVALAVSRVATLDGLQVGLENVL